MNTLKRIALLISGTGTTAESIIKATQQGRVDMEVAAVISSRKDALGIEKAKALQVETCVISPKQFQSSSKFGEALLDLFSRLKIDLISQNGWLPITPINVVSVYKGKIVNQHPGPLDPGREYDFGGKYMFGKRVICARLAYTWITGSDLWTEATTHFVTEDYDKGDLIQTSRFDLEPYYRKATIDELYKDPTILLQTIEKISDEFIKLEHKNVITMLELFSKTKNVTGFKRKSPLIPAENINMLNEVKKLAVQLFP